MMNTSKNQACKIAQGTLVKGKWHSNRYKIIKPLGYGATGYVYLASCKEGLVALKISENSMSITSEVNVLRHFSKVQGDALGPSLLDVDDWVRPGQPQAIPFYVMEYMKGDEFLDFVGQRGREWSDVLILQLLSDLERLHTAGWVFGDLKPENLLVVGPPPKVRWLDVGGTTIIGRSIKEYTEFFDRGYWGLGTRRAEPSYDLFAVSMIMINAAYPKRFSKSDENSYNVLLRAIHEKPQLSLYKPVLLKAIKGEYHRASEMRLEMLEAMKYTRKHKRKIEVKKVDGHTNGTKAKKTKIKGIMESMFIGGILFFGYILYLFGQFI